MIIKKCTKCGEERPIQDFYKQGDGTRPDCKFCSRHRVREYTQNEEYKQKARDRMKKWYANNKDRAKENSNKWRNETYRGYFNKKLTTTRTNAKKKGIECSVGAEYLESLYKSQGGVCALTGRKLVIGPSHMEKDALSLDRVDPAMGYVEGNIRLVTFQANSARGVWGDDALVEFCKDVLSRGLQ